MDHAVDKLVIDGPDHSIWREFSSQWQHVAKATPDGARHGTSDAFPGKGFREAMGRNMSGTGPSALVR